MIQCWISRTSSPRRRDSTVESSDNEDNIEIKRDTQEQQRSSKKREALGRNSSDSTSDQHKKTNSTEKTLKKTQTSFKKQGESLQTVDLSSENLVEQARGKSAPSRQIQKDSSTSDLDQVVPQIETKLKRPNSLKSNQRKRRSPSKENQK